MDGVILAAGPGTRLRPLTNAIPKALVSVGPWPLAEHVLRGFASAGVDNVVFVTGWLAAKVEAYFADGERWDVATSFVRQGEAKGTAHALAQAEMSVRTTPFFLAYGDIFLLDARNYPDFLEFHLAGGFDWSIMCDEIDDPWEGAAVYLDGGGRVERIIEKPPKGSSTTNLNKRGICLLDSRVFDFIADLAPAANGEYYLTDAIAAAIAAGLSVGGYVVRGFSSDVGTLERLEDARRLWTAKESEK